MRSIRTYVSVPALCTLALLAACGSNSSSGDGGSAGTPVSTAGSVGTAGAATGTAGAPVSVGGAPGTAGSPVTSGGDTSTAGTPGSAGSDPGTGGTSSGGSGGTSSGGTSSGGTSSGGMAGKGGSAGSGGSGGGGSTVPLKALGQYVLTWYTFQDNTPVNSLFSASGHILVPYVSVAVPFTRLANCNGMTAPKGETCGTLKYGDKLFVDFLKDRVMPNGMKHTGWVMVDDFCGDGGDDSYCFQDPGDGKSYPNVDIYIGDFVKSGMKPDAEGCGGPAGNGGELFNLSSGTPGALFLNNYGGATLGTAKCGDRQAARDQQYGPPKGSPFGVDGGANGTTTACWGYDGQNDSSDCSMCKANVTCAP